MDLNLLLAGDALCDEEFKDVSSAVTLQLNDLAPLLVVHHVAIAVPGLLEGAQDLLKVEVLGDPLHIHDAFACGSLLEVDVYSKRAQLA